MYHYDIIALNDLISNIINLYILLLDNTIFGISQYSKFVYIILRIFRNLLAKGLCAGKVDTEAGEDGTGGDANNRTFEDDVEGTGMGEGSGVKDVSDQIENEEQLLDLKNNEEMPPKDTEKKPSKKLDSDEKDQGVEMSTDFEGELHDVSEDEEEDDNKDDEDDGKEELERDLGIIIIFVILFIIKRYLSYYI